MTNDQTKSGGEHWSRQEIIRLIIRAIVDGKIHGGLAVPAGRAADDILTLLEPVLSRTPSHGRVSRACALIVAEAKSALNELANAPMGISLADWGNIAMKIMRAIDLAALSTPPETAAAPIPVEGEVIRNATLRLMAAASKIERDVRLLDLTNEEYESLARAALDRGVDEVREALDAPHGEKVCMDCHGHNPVWFAPNDVWNFVIGGPDAKGDPGGFYCPNCFIDRAEKVGVVPSAWKLEPEKIIE